MMAGDDGAPQPMTSAPAAPSAAPPGQQQRQEQQQQQQPSWEEVYMQVRWLVPQLTPWHLIARLSMCPRLPLHGGERGQERPLLLMPEISPPRYHSCLKYLLQYITHASNISSNISLMYEVSPNISHTTTAVLRLSSVHVDVCVHISSLFLPRIHGTGEGQAMPCREPAG
jgi:hypothetical protein